jgi:uncharacterized protein
VSAGGERRAAPPPSERARVRRLANRGSYERALVEAILDEGMVCHVGFVVAGHPVVIPTTYARDGERLILHGSVASRMLQHLAAGVEACVTVTLLDGLVLARSAFHHSMNYRSVVVFGVARELTEPAAKRRALDLLVARLACGRHEQVRDPNARELAATSVMEIPLGEASAKVRSGPPVDDAGDLGLPVWAGTVPLSLVPGDPVPAPGLAAGLAPPHVGGGGASGTLEPE